MAPNQEHSPRATSSLGFKYPSLRDQPLHTPYNWLEGKRLDDNTDGYWRIHDDLYDLNDFIKYHPGGKDWLELTKGTDITEAFECHHLYGKAEKLLPKYFVKKATHPRVSPFTFKDDGFYRTLKRNVVDEMTKISDLYAYRSKLIADILLVSCLVSSLLANSYQSSFFGVLAATFLALVAISAHNFFHQKDNFRMFYFDLSMMSSRDWRISHALSHHLFPNTVYDFEITFLEPYLQYLPVKKDFVVRYVSWLYCLILYALLFPLSYVRMSIQTVMSKEFPRKENFLPIIYFILMYFGTNAGFLATLKMFFFIQVVGGTLFGILGINAGHHHPDIFHDGDASRDKKELDWGIHQLDAVMERKEIIGSHFWVLITFGDHGLHHLFPTVDHGKLYYLYPVLKKTCKDFGVELRMNTTLGVTIGQYRQLARIEPNRNPPGRRVKE